MDKIEELLKDPKTDLQKQALTDTSYKNIDHSLNDDDTNFELATALFALNQSTTKLFNKKYPVWGIFY